MALILGIFHKREKIEERGGCADYGGGLFNKRRSFSWEIQEARKMKRIKTSNVRSSKVLSNYRVQRAGPNETLTKTS